MKIIRPSFEIKQALDYKEMLQIIEEAARTCYKSTPKGSPEKLIRKLIKSGHTSVLEHVSIGIKLICDRGVTHELVRHRVGIAYSQESTRYCNYNKEKFGKEITVIKPSFWNQSSVQYDEWFSAMLLCEKIYMNLIESGASPQEARSVLPNSLKTEIMVTANINEWRHIFKLRCSEKSHPDMVHIMRRIRDQFEINYPVFFE